MSSRLFKKFALIYLLVIAVSFVSLEVLTEHRIRHNMTERIADDLLVKGRIMTNLSFESIRQQLYNLARDAKARVTVIDEKGVVIGDSSMESQDLGDHLNRPEIQESRLKGEGISIRYSNSLKMNMVYVAVALKDSSQNIHGYVRFSRPLVEVEKAANDFRKSLLLIIFPVLLLFCFPVFYFLVKVIRPVHQMADFTEGVIKGGPKVSLSINNRAEDEIGTLAKNIQQMVVNLEERIASETRERQIIMSVFGSMAEGLIVLDSKNRIERANRSFLEMVDLSFASVFQKSLLEVFRNADLHDLLEQSGQTDETITGEITIKGDMERIMEVNIFRIFDLPAAEKKKVLVFHDVSQLKKLERMRIDFVANVSHEIKTPLTTIIGFIETICQTPPPPQETIRQFLGIIQDNALRLNRMVNDLLTLSNIELRKTQLHFEAVSLREIAAHILIMMENIAGKKQLTLSLDISENLPLIRADRDRLAQILINLLDNAVKATDAGGSITIWADCEGRELAVRVTDTGTGIPPGDIPKLGERFYRVDKSRSRKQGGTGLGLSIVKHLMEAHGGRMQIESSPGKGTTVSLYFPVVES